MGEYIWTHVWFGGPLKRSDIKRVIAEMHCDDWENDGDKIAALEAAASEGRPVHAMNGLTNYGRAEQFVELLTELKLPWRRESAANSDFGEDITLWDATAGERSWPAIEGEPAHSLPCLQAALAEGRTLEWIVAGMREGSAMPPALVLVEG